MLKDRGKNIKGEFYFAPASDSLKVFLFLKKDQFVQINESISNILLLVIIKATI